MFGDAIARRTDFTQELAVQREDFDAVAESGGCIKLIAHHFHRVASVLVPVPLPKLEAVRQRMSIEGVNLVHLI